MSKKFKVSNPVAAIFIGLLVGLFYSDVLNNEIALDDVLVLNGNSYVQSGIKSIPEIFSHDYFYGATQSPATRLSWRYRPLSVAMFAVIHEVAGNSWSFYHFISLLLYFLCGWMVFVFLRKWFFPEKTLLALAGSAAFIILPVHTEVVANIKSADELLACLFSILFLNKMLQWNKDGRKSSLLLASLFYTAALFSKESSVLLTGLTPLLLYAYSEKTLRKSILKSMPFILITILFLFMRLAISQLPEDRIDITNNPYFFASTGQKIATVSVVFLKYLQLLFIPKFFSFDYGYNHIPYASFHDIAAITSATLHILMLLSSFWMIWKRKAAGVFLLAYLAGVLLISNLFVDVGPIMADRFVFLPGLFLIIAILLIAESAEKIKKGADIIIVIALLVAFFPFAYSKTISRVPEWKNNLALYRADLIHVPQSFRVVAFNAMEEITDAENFSDSAVRNNKFRYGIALMNRAYRIYPDYKNMYFKWGIACYSLGDIDSAEWAWNRLRELWPTHYSNESNDQLIRESRFRSYMDSYNSRVANSDYAGLSDILNKALRYKPDESPVWALLARVYFVEGNADSARYAAGRTLALDPLNMEANDIIKRLK